MHHHDRMSTRELERLARDASLRSPSGRDNKQHPQPPNYARVVATLTDNEVVEEYGRARHGSATPEPGFVDALLEEARKRGIDV